MQQVPGCVGAALVDVTFVACLALIGGKSIDIDSQIDYYAKFIRAKQREIDAMGMSDAIEEIVFTSRLHYHLVYPLDLQILKKGKFEKLFFFIALEKSGVTLMQARFAIQEAVTLFKE